MSIFGDALGLVKGVGEGAWDGLKGTVSGVGQLAEDGYKLATDNQYREQAWNSAVNDAKAAASFALTAVTDPGKAADEIGNTASHAWHALETAYNQAAARGQGSEFIGQIFGQGAILVGTAVIPGGAEADAAAVIGDASRATALLRDAGKLTGAAESAGRIGTLSGDAGKAVDAANATDVVRLDEGAALKAPVSSRQAPAVTGPTGDFYSVAFQMRLDPTSYPGVSRGAHFQEANDALLQAMEGDPQFARDMQGLGVTLQRTPTGLAPRTSPSDWTWHHAADPGTLQLVPRSQHAPGSIFQNALHPNGGGGYSIWGR